MPTLLGTYCIRCGSLCDIVPNSDATQDLYICPKGHGVQRIADTSPDQKAVPADAATLAELEQEPGGTYVE